MPGRTNIGAFGGDPRSVTLFGHGTGAALTNLLLTSPITKDPQGEPTSSSPPYHLLLTSPIIMDPQGELFYLHKCTEKST